eukprot:s4400_g1.t1
MTPAPDDPTQRSSEVPPPPPEGPPPDVQPPVPPPPDTPPVDDQPMEDDVAASGQYMRLLQQAPAEHEDDVKDEEEDEQAIHKKWWPEWSNSWNEDWDDDCDDETIPGGSGMHDEDSEESGVSWYPNGVQDAEMNVQEHPWNQAAEEQKTQQDEKAEAKPAPGDEAAEPAVPDGAAKPAAADQADQAAAPAVQMVLQNLQNQMVHLQIRQNQMVHLQLPRKQVIQRQPCPARAMMGPRHGATEEQNDLMMVTMTMHGETRATMATRATGAAAPTSGSGTTTTTTMAEGRVVVGGGTTRTSKDGGMMMASISYPTRRGTDGISPVARASWIRVDESTSVLTAWPGEGLQMQNKTRVRPGHKEQQRRENLRRREEDLRKAEHDRAVTMRIAALAEKALDKLK